MASTPSSILLRGGTIVQHDAADNITTSVADLLIEGNRIASIGPSIEAPTDATKVIDCTAKILTPGLIDTHHHLWQTPLKGRHADEVLSAYLFSGNFTSSLFAPADAFWGSLGGGLEALNAGTTALVDHAHIARSPAHVRAALDGLVGSGLRGVFCPAIVGRVRRWTPTFELEPETLPAELERVIFDELAREGAWGAGGGGGEGPGRVRLGLAFDAWGQLDEATIKEVYARARAAGLELITSHFLHGSIDNPAVDHLEKLGLLGPDILLSHATGATPREAALLAEHGVHTSTTPSTELQMTHGSPVCFRPDLAAGASLGVDCHSVTAASLAREMHLALQSTRGRLDLPRTEAGVDPGRVAVPLKAAFDLATVKGARAIGMGGEVGALREGLLADVVVWDATSPAMVCAAQQDPVAAVVMHSSVADVETVIVDGVVRKERGKLRPADVAVSAEYGVAGGSVEWPEVARELLESRERIQAQTKDLDFAKAKREMFGG